MQLLTAFQFTDLSPPLVGISMSASTKATTRKTFESFSSADTTNHTSNPVGRKKYSGKRIRDSRHGDGWLSGRILGSIVFGGYLYVGKKIR
jgi:hypothetical protein